MPEKVILDPQFRKMAVLFSPEQLARLHTLADVVWARDEPMPAEQVELHTDAHVIIPGGWRYGDVRRFPKLRAILEVGGGFPSSAALDYEYCFSRGIRVLSCAPGFAPAVAEMALCLALASCRRVVESDRAFRAGATEDWGTRGANVDDFLLFDKPVGFIGFGSIARQLKALLAPFRCSIRAHDPWLTDAYLADMGVEPSGLDELLSASRFIFVLAVPSASNKALLDRERLKRIDRGAVLVLISRSHLVDFDALTEMVLEGRFRAAIDVFPTEPLPADHPIRGAEHAILSPHRAGGGLDTYRHIGQMVLNDLEAVLTGRVPLEMQSAQPEYIRARGPAPLG